MKNILYFTFFISSIGYSQGKYFGGNGSGYASSTIEITTLSVPSLSQDEVTIYPNPVVSNIHLNEQITEPVKIVSINGKIVLRVETNQRTIDVSKLSQGVYFLMYKNKIHQFIKK
ncbi:T9SS type A sorting domain-containing protein [Winogradskyella sp.]|uniref:T9SS type A sorting domain-containing protein n=1 Tax=Winogradskyella sp. TaxID=1883156 RepID=UPI001B270997|nr:T9SS type A sorting domain-containing protein [Winogradskyella sp.]MBO6879439.1 T9SS type A sorting domain-containing protein [Winogradskyella sp.]